jgi:hypothetical protein
VYAFWVRANAYYYRDQNQLFAADPPAIPPTGPPQWSAVVGAEPDTYDVTIPIQDHPSGNHILYFYLFDQKPTPIGQTGTRGPWRYMGPWATDIDNTPETMAWSSAFPLGTNKHHAIKMIAQWYPSGAFASTSWRQLNT